MTQEERLTAIIRAQGTLISGYQLIIGKNLDVILATSVSVSWKINELREEIERLKTMKVEEASK